MKKTKSRPRRSASVSCTFFVKMAIHGPSPKHEILHTLLKRLQNGEPMEKIIDKSAPLPIVGSFRFLSLVRPTKIHKLELSLDPRGVNRVLTCLFETEMVLNNAIDHGYPIQEAFYTLDNRGAFFADVSYCKADGTHERCFKALGFAREPIRIETHEVDYSSPLAELELGAIIKASEDLNELVTHMSPELYSQVRRRVYRRFLQYFRTGTRSDRLDLALSSLSETMREEVSRAEQGDS